MADRDLIGVVTVTYNSGSVLQEFLHCVAMQSYRDFVLIAVDNASNDNSLEILRAWNDERFQVIENDENLGVAKGNNQGIEAALALGCSYVLLINNDTEFDAMLFDQLVRGLFTHDAEMICPKMMYFDDPGRIWAAGGAFRPWLAYDSIHYGEDEIDAGQFDRARRITYVPTCCVLIRAEVFRKVGFMDEHYFVYVDDADFMFRAMRASVRMYYLPEAKLLHKVGRSTGGSESPFSIRYGTRNRIYFRLKHFGFAASIPWILLCEASILVRFAIRKRDWNWLCLKQRAINSSFALYRGRHSN